MKIECVNPILSVGDMAASLTFYRDILGFSVAPWGDDEFTSIDCNGGSMYLSRGDQGNPGTWVWIGFDGDIFELYDRLKAQGATIRLPPTNFPYALEMQVVDPDGHVLRFGTDPDSSRPFV